MGTESSGPGSPSGTSAGPPPRRVAGFELAGELGRGRFTTIYRVHRHSRAYAMKILRRGDRSERSERSFRRLAAMLASTVHPGLVRVYEAGVADDLLYMVMDLVDGRCLARVFGGGRLAVEDTVRLGIDVAGALGAAHQARLVHGDLRPRSIMINADGGARLVGFSLAVPFDDVFATVRDDALVYLAPEQVGAADGDVDGRSDLYGLGAVLYQCVIGQPPYVGDDVDEMMRLRASGPPHDPRTLRPELPPALSSMISKLLARNPDERYQSAHGLIADLWRLAAGAEQDFNLGRVDGPVARRDLPMLGRDGERMALLDRWHQARAGAGGVAVLTGAAGSGKTRLAGEVVAAIRREGGLVLAGKCEPDEGVPLAPMRRAIDEHLRAIAGRPAYEYASALERVRAAAGPAATLLGGLTLPLHDALGAAIRAEADRHHQVLVAVADFLAALATSHGGGLLYLDDAQWLDAATRRVLRHLAEQLAHVPLLVLLTGRDDPRSATNIAMIRSAVEDVGYTDLRLHPLPVDVVARLISCATSGLEVDMVSAASLAARSGGNPFTLLQYLDALVDAGLLQPCWGRWRLDLEASRKVIATNDEIDLVLRRLDGLDADSRSVLGIAAVHGAAFDYHLIAAACELPRHRVLDVADTAAWRNLVERRPDGRYRFLHDRIREALVAQFEPQALRAAHQRLADALAAADGRDAEDVFALARHCVLGEPDHDPHRAVLACRVAGRLALAHHAPAEAARHLEVGEHIARDNGFDVDSGFRTVLATAQQRAGQFVSAARTASTALDQTSDPIERARLLGLIAQANGTAWEGEDETEHIRAALAALGRPPARWLPLFLATSTFMFLVGQLIRLTGVRRGTARGPQREAYELEASLYAAAVRTYGIQLQPARALTCLLRQSYPVARVGPGPEHAHWLTGLAFAQLAAGFRRAARRNVARAVSIAQTVGDPALSGHMAWMDAFSRQTYGIDQGEALRDVLAEQGRWLDLGTQCDLITVLLWDALCRGDVREAQRLAEQRETLIRNADDPHSDATARLQSATVARGALAGLSAWLDRPSEAHAYLHAGADDVRLARWERLPLCGAAVVIAYQQHELGDTFDRAVAAFDALDLPVRILLPVGLGFYLCRAQGRVEQVRHATGSERRLRYRQARAAVRLVHGVCRTPLLRAHVEVTRAALLQVAGRPEAALHHLSGHQAGLADVGAPLVDFDAARVRAFALRDLSATAESRHQARLALALAEEHGWPHHLRRITSEFDLGTGSEGRDGPH